MVFDYSTAWLEKGSEYIVQRRWFVNWRRGVLKDKSSEQFADYFNRHKDELDEFVAHCAFMERYKVASPTEQAAQIAEKFGLMK